MIAFHAGSLMQPKIHIINKKSCSGLSSCLRPPSCRSRSCSWRGGVILSVAPKSSGQGHARFLRVQSVLDRAPVRLFVPSWIFSIVLFSAMSGPVGVFRLSPPRERTPRCRGARRTTTVPGIGRIMTSSKWIPTTDNFPRFGTTVTYSLMCP